MNRGYVMTMSKVIPIMVKVKESKRRKRKRSDPVLWQNPPYQQKIRKPKDNTQTPPKTSITQRLRTDLGRSVRVSQNPCPGHDSLLLCWIWIIMTLSSKIRKSYNNHFVCLSVRLSVNTFVVSDYSNSFQLKGFKPIYTEDDKKARHFYIFGPKVIGHS